MPGAPMPETRAARTKSRERRANVSARTGRHMDRLARGKYVEFIRDQNKPLARPYAQRIPEVEHVVLTAPIDIDKARMALGAKADEPRLLLRQEIDRQAQPTVDIRLAIDETRLFMQAPQFGIGKVRRTPAEADLREARARSNKDRECPR